MTDPPRKKQRAKRQEPDHKPNATVELETADLVSLATGGLVEGKVDKTRDLQFSDLEEIRDGMPLQDPKIIVDLGDTAPNPAPRPQAAKPRVDVTPPRAITSELRAPKRGLGLVVLVYVIATAALATSIYVRWFA